MCITKVRSVDLELNYLTRTKYILHYDKARNDLRMLLFCWLLYILPLAASPATHCPQGPGGHNSTHPSSESILTQPSPAGSGPCRSFGPLRARRPFSGSGYPRRPSRSRLPGLAATRRRPLRPGLRQPARLPRPQVHPHRRHSQHRVAHGEHLRAGPRPVLGRRGRAHRPAGPGWLEGRVPPWRGPGERKGPHGHCLGRPNAGRRAGRASWATFSCAASSVCDCGSGGSFRVGCRRPVKEKSRNRRNDGAQRDSGQAGAGADCSARSVFSVEAVRCVGG